MTPRWTYTEANATRWRHLFDDLLGGNPSVEVPLEGNGKSLCSLRIRISDALKWLADQFRAGDADMEPYALLKRRLRYSTHGPALRLHLNRPHAYRPIPHLDPALHARLLSALQRPDLKPTTRAKIEAVLHPNGLSTETTSNPKAKNSCLGVICQRNQNIQNSRETFNYLI